MTTSPESSRTGLPEPQWHEAMAEFRARAERLFETRRDRVEFLEATIAEQLAAIGEVDASSSGIATANSQVAPNASLDEVINLRTQVAQSRKLLNARASELKQLRVLLGEQAEGVEAKDVSTLLEQISELRLERDELAMQLADARRNVDQPAVEDAAHFEALQRRFEVAVQEIRELKAMNADLHQQVLRSAENSTETTSDVSTGFDWEQQKLRLMQQLEADYDDDDPKEKTTKLSIESTIRITDQVIAEKDRQIIELKALLEDATVSSNEGQSCEIFDNDERILKERERLRRLEDEWRGKLRQAEIDISVERAKLARERSEFETKRSWEASNVDKAIGKPATKQSGRWLNRLGLKDDEK